MLLQKDYEDARLRQKQTRPTITPHSHENLRGTLASLENDVVPLPLSTLTLCREALSTAHFILSEQLLTL